MSVYILPGLRINENFMLKVNGFMHDELTGKIIVCDGRVARIKEVQELQLICSRYLDSAIKDEDFCIDLEIMTRDGFTVYSEREAERVFYHHLKGNKSAKTRETVLSGKTDEAKTRSIKLEIPGKLYSILSNICNVRKETVREYIMSWLLPGIDNDLQMGFGNSFEGITPDTEYSEQLEALVWPEQATESMGTAV